MTIHEQLRSLNNSLNHIHECALRIINDDHVRSFRNMPEMTNQKRILQNNLECLSKKIYKYLHGLSPPLMNDVFQIKEIVYNLRNFQAVYSNKKKTVKFGTETAT